MAQKNYGFSDLFSDNQHKNICIFMTSILVRWVSMHLMNHDAEYILTNRSTSEISTKTNRSISAWRTVRKNLVGDWNNLKRIDIIEWSVAWYSHYCDMACAALWSNSNDIVLLNKLSDYVHMLFIFILLFFFFVGEPFAQMNALASCAIVMFV